MSVTLYLPHWNFLSQSYDRISHATRFCLHKNVTWSYIDSIDLWLFNMSSKYKILLFIRDERTDTNTRDGAFKQKERFMLNNIDRHELDIKDIRSSSFCRLCQISRCLCSGCAIWMQSGTTFLILLGFADARRCK